MSTDLQMHCLHVLDLTTPPGQSGRMDQAGTLLCGHVVQALNDVSHEVCVLGGSEAQRCAVRLGIDVGSRLAPPLGRTDLARRGLRSLLRDRGMPDAICAWGGGAGRLIRDEVDGTGPVIEINLADERNGPGALRVGPSPLTIPPLGATGRKGRISEQGLPVVALAVDPPSAGDAIVFALIVGTLSLAGLPVCGVIRRGASNIARALRVLRVMPRARMVVTDLTLPEVLAGADAGVIAGAPGLSRGRVAASVATAHASGVPVVACVQDVDAAYYPGDSLRICTAPSYNRPELTQQVLSLLETDGLLERTQREVGSRTDDGTLTGAIRDALNGKGRE